MSFWTAIVIIVIVGCAVGAYAIHVDAQARKITAKNNLQHIESRLDKLETRLENVETITLDTEKHRKFDRAL